MMLRQLREPDAPIVNLRLQATLIVRNSTAPPPGVPSVAVGVGAAPWA
jgi:hypothetical protein